MGLIKCPRCEINYMLDTEKMCSVCRREVRGESEQFDMVEMCSECGEHPVVPGKDLCIYCLKEFAQRENDSQDDENVINNAADIGIDSVSTMDEIEIDIDDNIDGDSFENEKDFFGDDDEEDGDSSSEDEADGDMQA